MWKNDGKIQIRVFNRSFRVYPGILKWIKKNVRLKCGTGDFRGNGAIYTWPETYRGNKMECTKGPCFKLAQFLSGDTLAHLKNGNAKAVITMEYTYAMLRFLEISPVVSRTNVNPNKDHRPRITRRCVVMQPAMSVNDVGVEVAMKREE